jgi:hypothetical protein
MVALRHEITTGTLLPPRLVHGLRERSSKRLVRMASAPGKRGFGRTLYKHIVPQVTREKTLVEKAVTMSYLCSYFADHIVLAEADATRIMEDRDLTPDEETYAWEQHYHNVVHRLAPQVPDADHLLSMMRKLEAYTRVPQSTHAARGRHWRMVEQVLSPSRTRRHAGHDPEAFLRNKIFEVVDSRRSTPAKARMICLVASLLADIHAWRRGADWDGSYAVVMIDFYSTLSDHPKVLTQLVNLT